jgi:hypothetical protein
MIPVTTRKQVLHAKRESLKSGLTSGHAAAELEIYVMKINHAKTKQGTTSFSEV